MRGDVAASDGYALQPAGDVTLNLDAAGGADEPALAKALTLPAHQQWTSITIGNREPAGHLDLWLATTAYLAVRGEPAELGIIAHGPSAAALAGHTARLLRTWAQDRPSQPVITARPAGTPGSRLPAGTRIERSS